MHIQRKEKIAYSDYIPLLFTSLLLIIPLLTYYFLLCRVWQEKEENKALQVLQGFRYVHSFIFFF